MVNQRFINNMISIIIIVKNDPAVEETIKQLIKIEKPQKTEILVVDSSEGKLDYIKNKYKEIIWIPYIAKTKKKITIPEQRDLGVKSAKGTIIVFTDANCIPDKNWLGALTEPLTQGKEKIVSGETKSQNETTMHDTYSSENKEREYLNECPTINLAIDISVFKKIGYFDTIFDYGSDVDFSWRAIKAGYKIKYAKNAIIYHDWGDKKQELKRSFRYGTARARLYKKHKDNFKNLLVQDYYILIYVLFILGLPLTFIIPFYPLILVVPLIKNYKHHPFNLVFDHLVYATGFIIHLIKK